MDLPAGFALAAVLEREDPRDAFVSQPLRRRSTSCRRARVVGTSSLRRVVQLRALRPDLRIEPLRGNLDTRLRKLDEGGYDAIVLAAAGLKRLGLGGAHPRLLRRRRRCCRAPARARSASRCAPTRARCATRLAHADAPRRPGSRSQAERAVSRALGGSCSMPLAAHARWRGGTLRAATRRSAMPPRRARRCCARSVAAASATPTRAEALGERGRARAARAGRGGLPRAPAWPDAAP